jgi:hypothetical protein
MDKKATVFVSEKPLKPSLIFSRMAGAYASGASFICLPFGLALDLILNYPTRLEKLAKDKYSILFGQHVNDE